MSRCVPFDRGRHAGAPHERRRVVIVGGGFSGAALAARLVADGRRTLRVTLVESGTRLGRGVAYGTDAPCHLLNTSAASMSLLTDDPGHFLRWLRARGYPALGSSFVPRRLYGEYVERTLIERCTAPGAAPFTVLAETTVTDIEPTTGHGFAVVLEGGSRLLADAVVLATGNPPPADPLAAWLPDGADGYVRDPWAADAVRAIAPTDRVLLVGTGLTMVDVALALAGNGHRGPIDALSRHGLLPRIAASSPQVLPPDLLRPLRAAVASRELRCVLRTARSTARAAEARGIGWHAVIDALRVRAPQLWEALDAADRRRFVRLLRPYWDVHRHRMAPAAARQLGVLEAEGQLRVLAGRIRGARETSAGIEIQYCPRGSGRSLRTTYRWVVNCTGSRFDRRNARPLERALLERGLLVCDPLGLGYVTDGCGMALGARDPVPGLYVLGPACRPRWWEHTAVPELRAQADALAERLLGGGTAMRGRPALSRA
ncbi:MAG TPA: FAD/NAD(P)-binding protein [Gammaproteobacteria bacterium]